MPEPSDHRRRPVLDAKLAALRASLRRSAPWSWRSRAAPTPRSSPGWPPTTLGPDRAVAVTAVSPSLAGAELDDCRSLAAEWGLRWSTVETDEMANAAYRRQRRRSLLLVQGRADGRRSRRWRTAAGATVVLGRERRRPRRPPSRPAGGGRAGARRSRWSTPGCTKADVREPVAAARPAHVGQAGRRLPRVAGPVRDHRDARRARRRSSGPKPALRRLGFDDLRVRHYRDLARIEVPVDGWRTSSPVATRSSPRSHGAGYRYVTLDLEGLRSGNLNAALPDHPGATPA